MRLFQKAVCRPLFGPQDWSVPRNKSLKYLLLAHVPPVIFSLIILAWSELYPYLWGIDGFWWFMVFLAGDMLFTLVTVERLWIDRSCVFLVFLDTLMLMYYLGSGLLTPLFPASWNSNYQALLVRVRDYISYTFGR